jgi:glycosyltransferase involved in cell wall biosynthesis
MLNKVCHITSVHPLEDIRIYVKECNSLADAGFETHYIVPGTEESKKTKVYIHSIEKNLNKNRLLRMTSTVTKVYKQALEINAELYHFHDPELIPIGLLLKLKGKKVIYDVHEDVPRQIISKPWIPSILRKPIANIFEAVENFASKKFDAIVTATPHINDRFKKIGCNAFNINNFPILNELFSNDIDWSTKKNRVCYVGNISKVRGILEMVKAIEQTSSSLMLAGSFYSEELKKQAESLTGWKKVVELGRLDREGIKLTLKQSNAGLVVLHPIENYIVSLPIKMFEYMAAGIPVIASDFPLWKEIIEGNQCGICVDPMDPKAIKEAIDWIVKHPKEAKRMGSNGREAVMKFYNWEAESKKLVALYTKILAS